LAAEYWQNRPDENNGPHYFVHYKGWKQSWDEWVPESRVHKFDEENLHKSESLKASYFKGRKTSSEESLQGVAAAEAKSSTAASSSSERARKRSKGDGTQKIDAGDETLKAPDMKLQIPHSLKLQLVDDWEYVTRQQRVSA
jgi:mortality factor 4-like protein 1